MLGLQVIVQVWAHTHTLRPDCWSFSVQPQSVTVWWPFTINTPLWCQVISNLSFSLSGHYHHSSLSPFPELLRSAEVRVHAPYIHATGKIWSPGEANVHDFGERLAKTHTDTSQFHPKTLKVAGINEISSIKDLTGDRVLYLSCAAGCKKTEIIIPTTLCPKGTPASPRGTAFIWLLFVSDWKKWRDLTESPAVSPMRSHPPKLFHLHHLYLDLDEFSHQFNFSSFDLFLQFYSCRMDSPQWWLLSNSA